MINLNAHLELRSDGRKPNELKNTSIQFGQWNTASTLSTSNVQSPPDGAVMYKMGSTVIFCTIHGPKQPFNSSHKNADSARVIFNVQKNPNSSHSQDSGTKDSSTRSVSHQVESLLSSLILIDQYPGSEFSISATIYHADGPYFSHLVNAAILALIDAGVSLRDRAVSVSVGYWNQKIIVDVNDDESTPQFPVLHLVYIPSTDRIQSVQMNSRVPLHLLQSMINQGILACKKISQIFDQALEKWAQSKLLIHEVSNIAKS